jgi:single-strand DNA-binding protein
MSFNKVILMGRIVADPELKQTTSGVSVCRFTIAVDRRYTKEEKQTDFINVVAWRQTAEFICRYFAKGSAILVCGELQTRSWTDNDGNKRYATEVVAGEVSFCESKNNSEGNSYSDNSNASQRKNEAPAYLPDAYAVPMFEEVADDEGLPF